jgi:hypothetical protein
MRVSAILAVAAAFGSSLVASQTRLGEGQLGFLNVYYPPKCGQSCGPIVQTQRDCERNGDGVQCICQWAEGNQLMQRCRQCIQEDFPDNENLRRAYIIFTNMFHC